MIIYNYVRERIWKKRKKIAFKYNYKEHNMAIFLLPSIYRREENPLSLYFIFTIDIEKR